MNTRTLYIGEGVDPRLLEALRLRGVPRDCAACGRGEWTLLGGYVTLPQVKLPGKAHIGSEVMPCAPLVCKTCGNTVLLNLIQLGLGDLVK